MSNHPAWYYDDLKQIGTDYEDISQILAFAKFVRKEPSFYRELFGQIGLAPDDSLIDFGSGPGDLVIEAAKSCARVYAVDVSQTALNYANERAEGEGISNIEFHHGGFLSYQHEGPQVDVIVTQSAFHHLPEFWKVAALVRMRDMLKDGGKLCIRDVIFSFDPMDIAGAIEGWIKREAKPAGEGIPAANFERHVSQEYSTFGWLLEEMLKRTGYEILSADYPKPEYAQLICRKV